MALNGILLVHTRARRKGIKWKSVEKCAERGKKKEGGMKLKNKCTRKEKMEIKEGEKEKPPIIFFSY